MDEEYYNMKTNPIEHSDKPLLIRPNGQRVWCCPHCMEKAKKKEETKIILDACCGEKGMWFNKKHPNALYIDIRKEKKGYDKDRPNSEVNPDIIMDFRDLQFEDNTFKLVVWDPPHMTRLTETSWLRKKYGILNAQTWKADLKKGFNECWRVLENNGVLIIKWCEAEIKTEEVLKLFHTEPLFGQTTSKRSNTLWLCFMKIPETTNGR